MFERFAPKAKEVLDQADAQARLLGAQRIGAEHLVLGLLAAEGDDVSVGWLRGQLGAASMSAAPPMSAAGTLPLDDTVREVFKRAFLVSAEMRAELVEPGHLLLALLELAPPAAAAALGGLGVDIAALRIETRNLLRETSRPALLPSAVDAAAVMGSIAAAVDGIGAATKHQHGTARRRWSSMARSARRASTRPTAMLAALVLVALALGAPNRLVATLQPTGAGSVIDRPAAESAQVPGAASHGRRATHHSSTAPVGLVPPAPAEAAAPPIDVVAPAPPIVTEHVSFPTVSFALARVAAAIPAAAPPAPKPAAERHEDTTTTSTTTTTTTTPSRAATGHEGDDDDGDGHGHRGRGHEGDGDGHEGHGHDGDGHDSSDD